MAVHFHEHRAWRFVDSIAQDIRFAMRTLRKDHSLLIGAIVALGLGVGVNNMVFTFVNAIMFRELPFSHPEQLVAFNSLTMLTHSRWHASPWRLPSSRLRRRRFLPFGQDGWIPLSHFATNSVIPGGLP